MIFKETPLQGLYRIELEKLNDSRGFFARSFCQTEFAERGLHSVFVQNNLSFNRSKGTIRGMHYQLPPYEEVKLVRCSRGAIYDVVIDLRPGSPTRGQWYATELNEEEGAALYIPEGFAHGFQTLKDDTEVTYMMGSYYHPNSAAGLRWNDPAFSIDWPLACTEISERDTAFEDYRL